MKLSRIKNVIKRCLDPDQENLVDIIFVGSNCGKEFIIVKNDKYATLLDVEEEKAVSYTKTTEERYFESAFRDFESVVSTLSSFDKRSGLEITERKTLDGEFEFVVKMEVEIESSDDFIIRKLLKSID